MIETALRSALIADSEIVRCCGDRVYPVSAPDNAPRPYMIYRLADEGSGNTEDECTVRMSVEIYPETSNQSPSYSNAVQIARAVSRVVTTMAGNHKGICIHSVAKPRIRDTFFRPTNQHGRLVDLYFRYIEE